MGKSKTFGEKISGVKHFYAEPLPGIPIMEIADDRRLVVENHMGVLEYSNKRICVSIRNGFYKITGDKLSISYMSRFRLVIVGRIELISIERGSSV